LLIFNRFQGTILVKFEWNFKRDLGETSGDCFCHLWVVSKEFFDGVVGGDNDFIRSNVLGTTFEFRNKGVVISPDL